MTNDEIAKVIKQIRKDSGLMQCYVAKKLHVSNNSLGRYESGAGRIPADILTELDDLYGGKVLERIRTKEVNHE